MPIRFVSEALGATVHWDKNNNSVLIASKQIIIDESILNWVFTRTTSNDITRAKEYKNKPIGDRELELWLGGYSLDDLFIADKMYDYYDVDAVSILEKKYRGNSWDEVQREILKEKIIEINNQKNQQSLLFLEKYKEKYSLEYMQISLEDFPPLLKLKILLEYDNTQDISVTDIINKYKPNNEILFDISKEALEQYGLTTDDIKGISYNKFQAALKISEELNKPLKDILAKFRNSNRLDKYTFEFQESSIIKLPMQVIKHG